MSNEFKDWIEDLKNSPTGSEDHNRWLIMRYPFLIPRNLWSDEIICDETYDYTLLDEMPEGWCAAFGEQMCEEIRNVLIEGDYLDKYRIIQIKEKYGSLRWYDGGAPKSIYGKLRDIIRKYEEISERTCILCGAPATWITTDWISPYCDECIEKVHSNNKKEINEFFQWWE